jgi:hypothetical protein
MLKVLDNKRLPFKIDVKKSVQEEELFAINFMLVPGSICASRQNTHHIKVRICMAPISFKKSNLSKSRFLEF